MMKKLRNFTNTWMKSKSKFVLGALFVLFSQSSFSQTVQDYCFSIYDAGVVCSDSSYLFIPNHLISNAGMGNIDLDGKIVLQGNVINNSSGFLFGNIETVPNGNLFMTNMSYTQSISGLNSSHFENIIFGGTDKNIDITDCSIKGIMTLNARLNLNENNLIIDNRDPNSINYQSGHIHSESYPPAYGSIQWNIGDAIANYAIPFGSGANNTNDLNLSYSTISPGSGTGFVKFATYHTPDYTNYPLPLSVTNLIPHSDMNVVDRFWIVDADYATKPEVQLGFKYTSMDIDNPNKIKASTLKAIRFNSNCLSWDDWVPSSTSIEDQKLVVTNSIPKQYFFANWTLASEEAGGDIWIPNAFTPDRDESYTNESFGPVITFAYAAYEFYIYNRWGELLFQSQNINNRWDGTYMNSVIQSGVCTWLIVLTKNTGKKYKYTGTVNVIL